MKTPGFSVFEGRFVHPRPGRTLIVGSQIYREREDRRRRYPDALGVDMLPGPGVDTVIDLEEPLPETFGTFAHIDCISVLEHSRRPWLLAANLQRALIPGGSIFVTVPFVWRLHAYPDDYWRFTPSGLAALFPAIVWQALRLVHADIEDEGAVKIPTKKFGDGDRIAPWFPRTEVMGFGGRA